MSDFIGTKLTMNLGERSYDIILKNGALENLYQFARLDRKVAVVTDSGVPAEYAQRVADQCRESTIITVPQGEASKSFKILETVLRQMLEFNMGRGDLVVAVGGGVVGDLAGFADLLADIVAVNRQRERLADQRIVKRSGLRVVAHIVGADLALFVELRRGRQRVNLVVGDSVDEIQFAGLECRQLGCVILHQRELQGVRASQAVHVPVVLVLDHRDVGAGH